MLCNMHREASSPGPWGGGGGGGVFRGVLRVHKHPLSYDKVDV